jgi:23S rRNA pseudouridine1911/1915/1917 synthase
MVVAKSEKAFENLQAQFKNREVTKTYAALVHGLVKEDFGAIEAKLRRVGSFGKFGLSKNREEGRDARTDYEVVKRMRLKSNVLTSYIDKGSVTKNLVNYLKRHANTYTQLALYPKTGRTHQIRVHIKSIGNPVVSDSLYTPRKLLGFDLTWCERLFLHAQNIEFVHPKTKKKVSYSCNLPNDLKNAILSLVEIKS